MKSSSFIHKELYWLFQGWKCCKPRVLTFDEFLGIKPCTTGKHSTTDTPPTIEKPKNDAASAPTPSATPPPTESSRAPVAAPQNIPTPPPPEPESDEDDESVAIPDGRICRRRACGKSYKAGSNRDEEQCTYHPGAPLFHEGSKGYTCCKRRVLEFDQFMKLEGCKTKPRHLFVGSGKKDGKDSNGTGEEIVEKVRYVIDIYFFYSKVYLIIYLDTISTKRQLQSSPLFSSKRLTKNLLLSNSPSKASPLTFLPQILHPSATRTRSNWFRQLTQRSLLSRSWVQSWRFYS